MYEILRRSEERLWGTKAERLGEPPCANATPYRFVLQMRENRSSLSREARIGFSALAFLLVAATLLPPLSGHWLVPAYALTAMAALTFALDRHAKSQPASETLELFAGRVRHRDGKGRIVELPSFLLRLDAERPTPLETRLFLRNRDARIEVGRCLSFDERRAVAPLIAAALADIRGG